MTNSELKKLILASSTKLCSRPDSRFCIPRNKVALVYVNQYGVRLLFRGTETNETKNYYYQLAKNVQLDVGLADKTRLETFSNPHQH